MMKPYLATPRPLRVRSRRTPLGYLAWFVRCEYCGEEIRPYNPLGWMLPGRALTVEGLLLLTPGAACDEARAHLGRHPTSLVP